MLPRPFVAPSAHYGVQAIGSTCALFIPIRARVHSALSRTIAHHYNPPTHYAPPQWQDAPAASPHHHHHHEVSDKDVEDFAQNPMCRRNAQSFIQNTSPQFNW